MGVNDNLNGIAGFTMIVNGWLEDTIS